MCRSNGFTLLELLIALAVLVTLLVIGVPSYSRVQEERQLEQAINQMRSDVLLGRQMAWHQHDSQIQIRFFPGDNWCYRLTDVSPQQCVSCQARCDIDGDGRRRGADASRWPKVRLQRVSYPLAALGFDVRRGGFTAGYVQLSNQWSSKRLISTGYGRLHICSYALGSEGTVC